MGARQQRFSIRKGRRARELVEFSHLMGIHTVLPAPFQRVGIVKFEGLVHQVRSLRKSKYVIWLAVFCGVVDTNITGFYGAVCFFC